MNSRIVIFTDLDGTLLDASTYSLEKAMPALELIKNTNTPLVLCSSKTRTEIEAYRSRIGNRDPFISENGGGIFIPRGYFPGKVLPPGIADDSSGSYCLLRLGARYGDLRDALIRLRKDGFDVRGFGDMNAEEIASSTGLSKDEAEMARQREFDEPFFFKGDESLLFSEIDRLGFRHTRGMILHILGGSDKGKAVRILTDCYRAAFGPVMTAALGDSPNDISMLKEVDIPFVVAQPDGTYDGRLDLPGLRRAPGIGPEGWNRAVLELLEKKG